MTTYRCLSTLLLFAATASADVIYDIDFSSPVHEVGQLVQTGTSSGTPTRIEFGTPTVVTSFGGLNDQVLLFNMENNTPGFYYDQISLSVPTFTDPIIRLEFDFTSQGLIGSGANFVILFETPSVRNVYFDQYGKIRLDGDSSLGFTNTQVGSFTDAESFHVTIDLNRTTNYWQLYKNSDLLGGVGVTVDERISSIRMSYGLESSEGTQDLSAVAVDNIKIATIPEPVSTFAVISFSALAIGVRNSRKKSRSIFPA